ncbi:uncharacterized protein FRV6_04616 [Fusarium oxysporum]|uniref:Uncharacterized protein n=1 Tax=Fusarium oxysporum TaxID=5507 RepID=A0A2H3TF72_FUSOX|nr:uncharacterized protein FRV6_04616 [Fusarium oxysporum]
MNIFGIKQPQSSPAARALQGWYPRSHIIGIGRYNEEGPSIDSWDFRDLTPLSSTFSFWPDPEDAARSLRRDGWIDVKTDIETDLERCPFVHSNTIQYLCLDLTAVEERRELVPGQLPPIPRGPPPPTRTVLLSAMDCNMSIEPLSSGPLHDGNSLPPLHFLVDGLISGVLDVPPESRIEGRLGLQLVYLHAYCFDMRSPKLVEQLRPENRQFHIDALTGPSVGKPPLMAWGRQVRRELRDDTRQLMNENSLLGANPAEYQDFISSFRSEFQALLYTVSPPSSPSCYPTAKERSF